MRYSLIRMLASLLIASLCACLEPAVVWGQPVSGNPAEQEVSDLQEIAVLISEGRYLAAKSETSRLLQVENQRQPPDWSRLAALLNLSVEARVSAGEFSDPEVLATAERVVQLRRRELPENRVDLAQSLSLLSRVSFFLGQFQRSLTLLDQVNAILEDALGPNDPAFALGLLFLGETHVALGNYSEARSEFQQALSINERALAPNPSV